MTRLEALYALRTLATGLAPDSAGVSRLLERIASRGEDCELLRDTLVELGAAALLDEGRT